MSIRRINKTSEMLDSITCKPLLPFRLAFWIVLFLWLIYTVLYTIHPSDIAAAVLEFALGVIALGALLAAGFQRRDCFLRYAKLSRKGLAWLALSASFMPLIWYTGCWTGWDWMAGLLYAPAGGISQELFFRAALLPLLLRAFKTNPLLALALHAFLFSLWHMPKVLLTAPLGGAIGVSLVTFVCGMLWGKQVQKDKTVVWIVVYHSSLLIVNSLFAWGQCVAIS
jgi:hypothetical protein